MDATKASSVNRDRNGAVSELVTDKKVDINSAAGVRKFNANVVIVKLGQDVEELAGHDPLEETWPGAAL